MWGGMGRSSLWGRENWDLRLGATCSGVKFNQFPTVHARFCPEIRQNHVSLPSRKDGFPSFLRKDLKMGILVN